MVFEVNNIKNNSIKNTTYGISTPLSFKSNVKKDLVKTPDTDTVEITSEKKEKKKKKGLGKRIAIGLGCGLGTLVIASSLISKGQIHRLTKLYNKKLVLKNLPENIEFKEAKSLDEAIKFSKEVLGIEELDKEFTLDALNYVNKGLVDVSNANKGKVFFPRKINFYERETAIASVYKNIEYDNFGELNINKKYFDNNYLDKEIESMTKYSDGTLMFRTPNESIYIGGVKAYYTPDSKFYNLIQKFRNNKESLTITEKRQLFWGLDHVDSSHHDIIKYKPDVYYDKIIKTYGNQKYSIKEFRNLSLEEQTKEVKLALKQKPIEIKFSLENDFESIYHEMGHLQDFVANLKNLHIKYWDMLDFFKFMRSKEKNEVASFVDNRFSGTMNREDLTKMLKEKPEEFKKYYPDLYEHLKNEEIQNTAGKVSWYAQTSIGEFVAEVYAKLIKGEQLPDDVMALYKKYNGPELRI